MTEEEIDQLRQELMETEMKVEDLREKLRGSTIVKYVVVGIAGTRKTEVIAVSSEIECRSTLMPTLCFLAVPDYKRVITVKTYLLTPFSMRRIEDTKSIGIFYTSLDSKADADKAAKQFQEAVEKF